jgi:hypothetical protein
MGVLWGRQTLCFREGLRVARVSQAPVHTAIEQMANPAELLVDGVEAAAASGCDFLDRVFLVVAPEDEVATGFWELLEAEAQGFGAAFQGVGATIDFGGDGFDELGIEEGMPPGGPAVVEDVVEGDFARPSAEVGAGLEFGKVFPEGDPDFLKEVLGVDGMGHEAVHVGCQTPFLGQQQA